VTGPELELRRRIVEAFARTGAPPLLRAEDRPVLEALAARHVVVLDDRGAVRMAHPFAAHREGASVTAGGRTWWGNCAWDAFGIAAALGLRDARVDDHGVVAAPGAVFEVAVPAARWWDDIAFT
jgi:Alkylmercury lyase